MIKIESFKLNYYNIVRKIYLESFPKEDRFSFLLLMFNLLFKRTNMYILINDNTILGFMYVINYENKRFILYFAISKEYRSKGYGSYLLKWYLINNNDNEIFLNIDEVNKNFNDIIIREKRLNFYLDNGFYLTDYLSVNGNSKGNILSSNKKFDIEEYKLFDKKISKWFMCKCDKFEKNKDFGNERC